MKIQGISAIAVGLLLTGCSGDNDSTTFAADSCKSLAGTKISANNISLPTRGASVTSANVVPSSPTNAAGEFCEIQGQIDSVDVTAQPIKFILALPTQWNNKALHVGGGGWNGFMPSVTGNPIASSVTPPPLTRGYAVFGSDSGHTGLDPTFQLNSEQIQNYGGDQLKKVRDTAMELIRKRYGDGPSKTYFAGGSNGGREAMAVMQRWGQDYDGILSVYPALAWVPTFLKLQQLNVAMRANGGQGWISQAKARTVRNAIIQACDAQDGLADGIISNYNACSFDPAVLRCPNGLDSGDSCLSDAQIATLKVLETPTELPYQLANGIRRAPAFNRGADWSGAIVTADLPLGNTKAFNVPANGGTPSRTEIGWGPWYGDGFVRYGLMQNPSAAALEFDVLQPGSLLPRLQALSSSYDATNPDIKAFLDKGGKLLLLHGQADQLVQTQPTIDYYRTITQRFGQQEIDKAVRFYLLPGYSHVGGLSFNPVEGMDMFAALEAWVERGLVPETMVAKDINPGANGRTRPMCRYPSWPRYNGTGDVNSAASFTCVTG